MKTPRNVKRSFYAALETLLENAATFGTAFNVYYESDLRDGTTPTFPYIYILDANVPLEVEYLPVISVWFRFGYRAFQIGGPALWHAEIVCDIYGKNRGDREDLAAAIAEGISSNFTINDYSGASPSSWGTAGIYEGPGGDYWTVAYESVADELSVEGTLLNWASASTQCWCKPT
jgi:hypothetical protein